MINAASFVGCYIVAFAMLWRLAIVGVPFVVLLVIPGFIYGRALMNLARKMKEEYSKAATIAEQAISSIRTVYSFVGERKTQSAFSAALQGPFKLGLRQGVAKGLAIGGNGVVLGIWAFMCWYGSRLVMYHGAQGGTVFATGAVMAIGGLYVMISLSLQYFQKHLASEFFLSRKKCNKFCYSLHHQITRPRIIQPSVLVGSMHRGRANNGGDKKGPKDRF